MNYALKDKKENVVKDKSYKLAIEVIITYQRICSDHKEFVLSRQLLKSGTSIGANVREALNAESTPDFIHKLSIAQKECDETLYWLELLYETGYIGNMESEQLHNEASELLKIIRSIIITTKSNS